MIKWIESLPKQDTTAPAPKYVTEVTVKMHLRGKIQQDVFMVKPGFGGGFDIFHHNKVIGHIGLEPGKNDIAFTARAPLNHDNGQEFLDRLCKAYEAEEKKLHG